MSTESSTIHRSSRISLPEVLQTMAQQRQSSLIKVQRDNDELILLIQDGHLSAIGGLPPGSLLRAAVWGEIIAREVIIDRHGEAIIDQSNFQAAKTLVQGKIIDQGQLKEAIETLLAETYCELCSVLDRPWQYIEEVSVDPWIGLQQKLEIGIATSGLLMEAMRRQDEMLQLRDHLIDQWDLLAVQEEAYAAQKDGFDERERAVVEAYGNQSSQGEVVRDTWVPVWHVRLIAAVMCRSQVLQLVPPTGLVAEADRQLELDVKDRAEGLYRRALERGSDLPRVHLALGQLAQERGDHDRAAADYLEAAARLEASHPGQAAKAYRSALALGAAPKQCLLRLYAIHLEGNDLPQAIEVCFELAEFYLGQDGAQAAQMIEKAAEHGSDRLRCERFLARIAEEDGDTERALVAWQNVLRLCEESGDQDGQIEARAAMLRLDPGQLIIARAYAEDLVDQGAADIAMEVLRIAINSDQPKGDLDAMIGCREYLAELDTGDADNSAWLSQAYHHRSDQKEGVERLYELAERQQAAIDLDGVRETLQRLVDLDSSQIRAWQWLAQTECEQGLLGQARRSWHKAVDVALGNEDWELATRLANEGLATVPYDVKLQLCLVRSSNRLGDRAAAIAACRAAGHLAQIQGDCEIALQCFTQLLGIHPDDLHIHAEVIALTGGDQTAHEDSLRAGIAAADRTSNYGLALAWSDELLTLVGDHAYGDRERHLDLLLHAGDMLQMLQRGRELAVDYQVEDDSKREMYLLEKLIEHFPNEVILQTRYTRVLAQRRMREQFYPAAERAITLMCQAQEHKQALSLLSDLREQVTDDDFFDRLEARIEEPAAG